MKAYTFESDNELKYTLVLNKDLHLYRNELGFKTTICLCIPKRKPPPWLPSIKGGLFPVDWEKLKFGHTQYDQAIEFLYSAKIDCYGLEENLKSKCRFSPIFEITPSTDGAEAAYYKTFGFHLFKGIQ